MMNFTLLGLVTPGYDAAADISAAFNGSSSTVAANVTPASAVTSGGAASYSSHPVSVFLEKYYAVFLLAFGTIGNLLSFAVLSRRTFRKTTISLFLRYLTLADLGALYTGVVLFIGRSLFNYDVRKASELSCKFHRWLSYVTCDLSSWALVLVSTARLVSIVWPMKRLVTRTRVYAAIIITTVVLFLINLPMFVMYGDVYTDPKKPKLCTITSAAYDDFYTHVWGWLVLIKFTLLPGLILVCLNTALIVTVSRTGKAVNKIDEFGSGGSQNVSSAASAHVAAARWKKKGAASKENKGYDSDHSDKVDKRHPLGTPHKKKLENCAATFSDLQSGVGHLDADSVCNPDKECLRSQNSGASDEIPLTDFPKLTDKFKEAVSKDSNGNSSTLFLDYQNNLNTDGSADIKTDHGFSNLTDLCPTGDRQGDANNDGHFNLHHGISQTQLDSSIPKAVRESSTRSGFETDRLPKSHFSEVTSAHLPSINQHEHQHHHHTAHSAAGLDDDMSVSSVSSEVTEFPNSSSLHSRLNGSAKLGKKQHKGDHHHKKASAKSKSRSLTRSLLLINTVFLVCTIPISVYLAGKVFLFTGPGYSATQEVFNYLANFIMYTNNSINFILYCVSGSRFRQQLQLMMRDLLGAAKRLVLKLVCPLRNR